MKSPVKKKADAVKKSEKKEMRMRPPVSRSGFSMLELLTVLILLGVVAGISAPAVGRILEGLDFRQQVGNVMAALRKIRLEAVVQGRPITMKIDDHRFIVMGSNKEEEERSLDLSPDSELILEPESIIFSSESTVTPAIITLTQGDRTRIISMDPLTALPVVK